MTPELNVLALYKGKERYVFLYDDLSKDEMLDSFRHQAANPEMSFSWFDAFVMTEKMREQGEETNGQSRQAAERIRY